jgi:acyl carrier protein
MLDMDAATFRRVVRPKLEGAQNLDRLLPDVSLFIVFSSIIGTFASPGMINYATANAGLDALAADRRARGAHGLSVQWGGWHGTGVHAGEAVERSMDELRRQGIDGFTPAQAVRLFDWLAAFDGASVMVMPIDWQTFFTARTGHELPLFRERSVVATGGLGAAAEFAATLAAAPTPQHRRRLMESTVRDTAARVLRIPAQKLDPGRPLGSMGLDSLMAIELRNRLTSLLGRPLSATLTFNYPTVEKLAAFFLAETRSAPEPVPPRVPAGAASASLGDDIASIAALSDDDVALKLRAGRRGRK